eukprot:2757335-Prymnesium_polylepis.1
MTISWCASISGPRPRSLRTDPEPTSAHVECSSPGSRLLYHHTPATGGGGGGIGGGGGGGGWHAARHMTTS